MIERIKEIAQYYDLSSTAFADKVDVPRPVISHIFSERNRPSLEVVQKIGLAYPELDLQWLLYGKGKMLKTIAKQEDLPPGEVMEPKEKSVQIPEKEELILTAQDPIQEHTSKPAFTNTSSKKKTVKIVFLYDDNSFEEFYS